MEETIEACNNEGSLVSYDITQQIVNYIVSYINITVLLCFFGYVSSTLIISNIFQNTTRYIDNGNIQCQKK